MRSIHPSIPSHHSTLFSEGPEYVVSPDFDWNADL
jgi:hypothetical protein